MQNEGDGYQPNGNGRPTTGARSLCESLLREGVDTIFGYPGGAVLHIYDELVNFKDSITHILARHEQGAVHMAEGHAKVTGKVAFRLGMSHPRSVRGVVLAVDHPFIAFGGVRRASRPNADWWHRSSHPLPR